MNVVDSSAWLEYFADGPNATFFAKPIEAPKRLIVPTVTLFEVFKRVLVQRDEGAALQAVAVMGQGQIIELDTPLALTAAKLSAERRLPMADSMILATAQQYDATIWTQDADFKDLPNVEFKAARKS
jgi:predicted nucleic acid-binding protein